MLLQNWCSIDWNLFVDEDELDEKKMGDNMDFGDFSNLNMGDMGGDDFQPYMQDEDSDDSDDEEIPGLEVADDVPANKPNAAAGGM